MIARADRSQTLRCTPLADGPRARRAVLIVGARVPNDAADLVAVTSASWTA